MEGTAHPLSADVGIVKAEKIRWLYDVGNGENGLSARNEDCNVVLSHFHPDHIGNLGRIRVKNLYISKETCNYIPEEIIDSCSVHIVSEPVRIGNLHIFPLPSSHAKGSLGLEVDGAYAFVGDALYCKTRNKTRVYNAQLLKAEMEVLKNLSAPFLLVSHFQGLIRKKADVLEELETIYAMRRKDSPEIAID